MAQNTSSVLSLFIAYSFPEPSPLPASISKSSLIVGSTPFRATKVVHFDHDMLIQRSNKSNAIKSMRYYTSPA